MTLRLIPSETCPICGIGYYLPSGACDHCDSARPNSDKDDANNYHAVMRCLLDMKMEHGLCEPRERKACTHCNAKDKLKALVSAYKGRRIKAA